MDNAPAHLGAELADSDLHPVRRLAPHSPFLNPIDNMFSVFKAGSEQRLSDVQDRLDDRAAALAAEHGHLAQLIFSSWMRCNMA